MDLETPTYEINLIGGTRGLQGPEGKIGPQGKTGPQGEPGMGVPDGGEEGQTIIKQGNATIWDFFDFSKLKNKPTKLSQFNNDTNFVDHTVSNLINYYDKNSTYTKEEINQMISSVATMSVQVVEELPTTDISSTTIYLKLKTTGEESNIYDEYLYVNNTWEKIGDTSLDLSNYATKDYVDQLINSSKMDMLPVGTVFPWFSNDIPTNFLELNGQAVSRTTYSDLFELYGTTYGTGDGSTTFNLPDLSGRVPVGLNVNKEWFDQLGKTGGNEEVTLTIDQIPSHSHNIKIRADYDYDIGVGSGGSLMGTGQFNWSANNQFINENTGGGQPHTNLQPYITVKYIVKAQYSDGHLSSEDVNVINNLNSTSSVDVLSANMGRELKAMLDEYKESRKWKLVGTVNGGTVLNLPSAWNELLVSTKISGANEILSNVIFKELVDDTTLHQFDIGGGKTIDTSGCRAVVSIKTSLLQVFFFYVNNQDKTSNAVTTVYYR